MSIGTLTLNAGIREYAKNQLALLKKMESCITEKED